MEFSKEWDKIYKDNLHLSIWPWSDLVSYVMHYARPRKRLEYKVLELGCGAGANIPFFMSLGVEYYAIEGSKIIVRQLKNKFIKIAKNIQIGDFTKKLPFPFQFDLIVDRGAMTCNTFADIKNCLSLIHDKLKNEGKYIGIDYLSKKHSDFRLGRAHKDGITKTDIKTGHLAGTGCANFLDKEQLIGLFDKFSLEILEHKIIKSEIPQNRHTSAFWNLVARKD